MKALSLWQPWATLIAIGAKRIETRSWSTPYRGPIAIHAAKYWHGELLDLCLTSPFVDVLGKQVENIQTELDDAIPTCLPRGALVATATLVKCEQITVSNAPSGNERAFGDYTPGRFAWTLENVHRLVTPIPWAGARGLFDVPDSALQSAIPNPKSPIGMEAAV